MPGDLVVFADNAEATRLIHALADLRRQSATEFVLIGGLATASFSVHPRSTIDQKRTEKRGVRAW